MSEFFKKYQNLTSLQGEKITSANYFQIEQEKSYDYLLITYIKKLMVDRLPEVRVRVSFVECLEILWIT